MSSQGLRGRPGLPWGSLEFLGPPEASLGFLGHSSVMPHARSTDVDRVFGAFILLESPVDFGSVDKLPVDVIFGLFAPENAGVNHLKALAIVSRTLRDNSICAKLRANPDQQTLFTILTENQKIQAA